MVDIKVKLAIMSGAHKKGGILKLFEAEYKHEYSRLHYFGKLWGGSLGV